MSQVALDPPSLAVTATALPGGHEGLPSLQLTLPAGQRAASEKFDAHKRLLDCILAILALIALGPIMAAIAAFLLIVQGRPILIRHTRVGRGRRPFKCLKFRSMIVDADHALQIYLMENSAARDEWERTRKLRTDPRVTWFGRVMRTSSIDELPQLLNIMSGDMSFVGPRPVVDSELDHYGVLTPKYLQVRPGLTGLWQISGRSNTSYAERVALDAKYVDTRSIATDLKIIVQTIPAVLRSRGAM